ncbi:dihydroorotate dehydrogenase [Ligilactobacillus hohenheimensis]|uniref:dihydroorotate dehydrogenase n=1 Tax=Ligilactobacillus hohenheimensis TaxID=2991832 RepID=UPI0024B9B3B9|nr:dihydroorotate dehydrogenase [Ligilactobacillus hohenheimensis]
METTNRLAVKLPGLALKNPLMPASGTFGFGDTPLAQQVDLNKFGAMVIKTATPRPRVGNPEPRIAVLEDGVLNAVGLAGPGVDAVANEKIPAVRQKYPELPIIASVSGGSVEEYAMVAAKLAAAPVNALEINVSCPNVKDEGMLFGTDPVQVEAITRAVKDRVGALPVYVKLTPNVTDIVAIALAAERGGANGLSLINTLLGMHIDVHTGQPVVANVTGGYSGQPVKPVAVRMIYQVAHATTLPIIGMGGVATAEDVIEMMMAGASAVAVGSAHFEDAHAIEHIAAALPALMDELHIESLTQLHADVRRKFTNED